MKIPEGQHLAMTIGIGRCATGWHARAYKVPVDFDQENIDESELAKGEKLAEGPHRDTEWEAELDAERMAAVWMECVKGDGCIVTLETVN